MNFWINKIQLWFRRPDAAPITYEFEANKVNVITGDSSTGKSSVLRIIDYCLLAEESDIVEDVINESVSWYGLSFHINDTDCVIVREAPTLGNVGQGVYWAEDDDKFPRQPISNTSREWVLGYISDLAGLANRRLTITSNRKINLTLRNFLALNYLTEDIIASNNTYIDANYFLLSDIRKGIGGCLNIAIGRDEDSEQEKKCNVRRLKADIKKETERKAKSEDSKKEYNKNLASFIERAYALNLPHLMNETDVYELLHGLNEAILKFRKGYESDMDRARLDDVKLSIQKLRADLSRMNRLKREVDMYNKRIDEDKDSLLPIEHLKKEFCQVLLYDETHLLVSELTKALNKVKKCRKYAERQSLPDEFQQRLDGINTRLSQLVQERDRLQHIASQRLDLSWYESVVALKNEVCHLKCPQNEYIGDKAFMEMKENLAMATSEYEKAHNENIKCIDALNQLMLEYYQLQGSITSRYNQCKPMFNTEHLSLTLYNPEKELNIRNVGSKSNYMFLHLCFFLGLHELILSQEDSPVPSFLFIDQPSIPYYGSKNVGNDGKISDDDAKKLSDAFNMLNQYINKVCKLKYKKNFQIIMVEHASPDYWRNLENFKTNCVFTKGDGLIPERVCKFYN